ncbi:MAG: hypothetical protein M1830_010622, partial [Pleopsidium flavum]
MTSLTVAQIAATVQKTRQAILGKANTTTVSERQRASLRDSGVRGPVWVSRVTFPASEGEENDLRQLLFNAIAFLGRGDEEFARPPVLDVEAQWTGHRLGVGPNEPEPPILEKEKFEGLMKDVKDQTTILYIHGGIFIPASYRNTTAKLAELTKGRCLAVRHRLSPQNPFPAALLDVLIAYLSLLYPPPGSYHSPVPASSIIFAGDSSGGCLALAAVQVIIAARHAQASLMPSVRFHNRSVIIPMPGGVTLVSPFADQTCSLPSWVSNATFDIMQDVSPVLLPSFPSCPIWPTDPPRGDLYCEISMLCHPLVSPTTARSWTSAPPMWIAMGEERLSDGAKVIAQTAANQGVVLQWEEYKSMPHNWPMLFPSWWQST